jgi:hypothetical protein
VKRARSFAIAQTDDVDRDQRVAEVVGQRRDRDV